MTGRRPKYFFSYSREDSPFVLRLAKELRGAGASLWIDQLDIAGGERWDDAVETALRSCPGILVVLSPDAVASQNIMDEVSYALEKQKKIVPILYRECEVPFRLRRVQRVDFTRDYRTGFNELCRALDLAPSPGSDDASEQPRAERSARLETGPVITEEVPEARKSRAATVPFWHLALLAVLLLLFYVGTISTSCYNADWAVLAAVVALPLSLVIRKKNPESFFWILIPAASAIFGFPYGHGHGTMTRSPLFGLEIGEMCQQFASTYVVLLGVLFVAAVLDFSLVKLVYGRSG